MGSPTEGEGGEGEHSYVGALKPATIRVSNLVLCAWTRGTLGHGVSGANDRDRTDGPLVGNEMLYR